MTALAPLKRAIQCEAEFKNESGDHWLNTGQAIEIGGNSPAQPLHRDLENLPALLTGQNRIQIMLNFLIALSDFTSENGATRLIPGSNHWGNYNNRGNFDMTIPATMKAGDVLILGGSMSHGGGFNRTLQARRALALAFQPSCFTPEEAHPLLVPNHISEKLSTRQKKLLGFDSQYPKDAPPIWSGPNYQRLGYSIALAKATRQGSDKDAPSGHEPPTKAT